MSHLHRRVPQSTTFTMLDHQEYSVTTPILGAGRKPSRPARRRSTGERLEAMRDLREKKMSVTKRLHLTGLTVEWYFMIVLGLICLVILNVSLGVGAGWFSSLHKTVRDQINPPHVSRYAHAEVPPVVHFVWTNQYHAGFTFTHALSIISAVRNIQPEVTYLWFIREPRGIWWNLVLRKAPSVTLKYLPLSERNAGFKVAEHSKVIKLDKLIEYGGIFVDFNVIVLRSLDPLRKYTTVLGHEEKDTFAFSESLILASKNSIFIRKWRRKYDLVTRAADISIVDFGFTRELAEIFPKKLYAEPDSLLRPYKSEMEVWNKREGWDWRSFYALNLWTREQGLGKLTPEDIDCMDTALGKVLRNVYYGKEKLQKCDPDKAM